MGFSVITFAQKKPKNVLFIASDDLNTNIGCFGSTIVKTPNLDRLAKHGVKFTNAHCQFPLCSPSRTSILTGLRPDSTKVFDLATHFRKTIPDVVTLPQHFKNHGYYSARVGKIYHYGVPRDIGKAGLDDPISWNETSNPIGRDKIEEDKVTNLTPYRTLGAALSYLVSEGTDEEQTDGKVATEAIRIMNERKNAPFFLAVGFYRPHSPYVAPKKYFDLYNPADIILPESNPLDSLKVPRFANSPIHPPYLWQNQPEQKRKAIHAYYASISFMDAQLGRVLDELDRLGLTENTTIVFWSDHGYHLSEHGQWMKETLFEESTHTPLIMSDPEIKPSKMGCTRTVELLDIYPTLTDLCGLESPKHLMGVSLKPLIQNPQMKWDRPAYTQMDRLRANVMGRTVRTENWRYTEWNKGKAGAELYDLKNDPKEQNNLAENPKFAKNRNEMKKLIEKVSGELK